jgi:hypothetical protein
LAYQALGNLGAPSLQRVITIGGARNQAWTTIRRRVLGVEVGVVRATESSFGALLALHGGPP